MYVLPSPVCFSLLAGVEHQSLWMKRPRLQVLCTYADGKGAPASCMKRQRVCAPRIPTLKDVHHCTRWSLCLRVYHKFHVERIGHGRKRVNFCSVGCRGHKDGCHHI
ncbi:hypothetical protein BRADI_2g27752v3 [Brachypodium distachyon]|uniref:Uncharacterized protein n=1 Tax=Brachypodium distachyon TaxID=15368 RepID=A0A2K2DAZ8_BRADI|nr:hypothetical protein BRADI_2g27752v3 [Brachypodium distachyon]